MELMELLKTRRTYRRFSRQEVSREIIDEILLAARYASSAGNKQPLSYVVVRDKDEVAGVFEKTRWAAYLPPEQGHPKEEERPVLFIAVVGNPDINPSFDTDAGLAISNMTLAAWNHGVGSCIIGACDKPALSKMLGLAEGQVLHTVVAFGYPSHKSTIVDVEDARDAEAIRYYLDGNRDYVVPKRKLSDTVRYF